MRFILTTANESYLKVILVLKYNQFERTNKRMLNNENSAIMRNKGRMVNLWFKSDFLFTMVDNEDGIGGNLVSLKPRVNTMSQRSWN